MPIYTVKHIAQIQNKDGELELKVSMLNEKGEMKHPIITTQFSDKFHLFKVEEPIKIDYKKDSNNKVYMDSIEAVQTDQPQEPTQSKPETKSFSKDLSIEKQQWAILLTNMACAERLNKDRENALQVWLFTQLGMTIKSTE